MAKLSILAELIGADRVAEGLAMITGAIEELEKEQAALQKHLQETGQAAGGAAGPGGGVALLANGLKDVALGFLEGAASAAAAYISINKLFSLVVGGIREFAELERLSLRLEAVFKATGGRAGVTAEQIGQLANALSQTTFVTQQAVLQGAASLATFRSVHGEAFERVLKLSQDVSEVMGRDFRGTVVQMGRAMDAISSGSVEGMRRAFSFLSPAILETAKQMAEAGKTAEAMKYILDETEKSVGGGGAAAHGGLAGSVDSLTKAWSDMWQEIGKIIATRTDLEGWFKSAAQGVRDVLDAFNIGISGDEENLLKVAGTITRLRDQLKGVRTAGPTAFVGNMEILKGALPGGQDAYALNEQRRQARIVQITTELKVAKEEQALLREDIALRKQKGETEEQLRVQHEKDIAWNQNINELTIEGNKLMAEAAEENRKVGQSITDGLLSPTEKYNKALAELNMNWRIWGLSEEQKIARAAQLKKQMDDEIDAINKKNASTQKGIQLTDQQNEKLREMMPLVTQLVAGYEEYTRTMENWVTRGLEAAQSPTEKMAKALNMLKDAADQGLLDAPGAYQKMWDFIMQGMDQATDKTEELTEAEAYLIATTQNLMSGFADIVTNSLSTAGDAWEGFKNLILNVGKQILDMIVKLAIINPLMNAVFGTSYSTIGSMFGAGSAIGSGGVAYPLPPAIPSAKLATGGSRVFTRPTLLSVAEMGPELVEGRPLAGGGSGGKSGGQPTIYIDARNSNGDAAVQSAVREALRRAMPSFVETSVQMVRQRHRMDPGYLR